LHNFVGCGRIFQHAWNGEEFSSSFGQLISENNLKQVPILSISIHTKMFKKVCMTFVKSLMFYSMMIIAFAFSFFSLQGDKFAKDNLKYMSGWRDGTNDIPVTNATRNERFNNFNTVGSAIIKSFVMLTGELETSYVS
jgi:hypothetical protein